jgi:hypothetical protein
MQAGPFFFLLACTLGLCVKPTYDETHWTKLGWSNWKLPYSSGLAADDAASLLNEFPELSQAEQSSLDGPLGRSQADG